MTDWQDSATTPPGGVVEPGYSATSGATLGAQVPSTAEFGRRLTALGIFSAASHNHSGVYEPSFMAGTTAQYLRGDKTWQTLNQAAVAGLKTTDLPTFAGMTIGTSGGGERRFRIYCGNAGKYGDLFTSADHVRLGAIGGGYMIVYSEQSALILASAANQPMFFSAGGQYIFRDADASDATRATIDSGTGDIYGQGRISCGALNAPSAAAASPANRDIFIDEAGSRIAVRVGGAWKYAPLS